MTEIREHTFPSIRNQHFSAHRNVRQCFRERTKLNGEHHLLFHNSDNRCFFQRREPCAAQKIGEIHVVEYQHVREEVNPLQFGVARKMRHDEGVEISAERKKCISIRKYSRPSLLTFDWFSRIQRCFYQQ